MTFRYQDVPARAEEERALFKINSSIFPLAVCYQLWSQAQSTQLKFLSTASVLFEAQWVFHFIVVFGLHQCVGQGKGRSKSNVHFVYRQQRRKGTDSKLQSTAHRENNFILKLVRIQPQKTLHNYSTKTCVQKQGGVGKNQLLKQQVLIESWVHVESRTPKQTLPGVINATL